MSIKTGKKLGFWTAVAMLVGSIVGIGIFFKNGSVTRATGDNGVATLLAWIIGGLISLFAAISFSEIASQKTKNVHGLAGWSESALGKKFGYFVRFNLPVFYYGILLVIFGVFVSESFFAIIGDPFASNDAHWVNKVWVHIIVGIGFDIFFIGINFISIKAGSWISRFSTVLKLVPLILVAVAGLALANTNHSGGTNSFTNGHSFSFTGLLAALPAVLFAYDAFLDAGTYSSKVEGGSKTVSKAIIFTLISVLVLYSLISVAHILHGAGYVGGLFSQVFPSGAQNALQKFVWVFLFISACGVANGVTAGGVAAVEQATRTHTIAGSKSLVKRFGEKRAAVIIEVVIALFWGIVVFVPALVLKSDAFVDDISNFPTLFFFAIYGLNIVGYWLKRDKISSDKINSKLWYTASAIAVVGIIFVVGYQLVYGFTIQAFLHQNESSHAGFLVGESLPLIKQFAIFAACIVIFFAFPIINNIIVKKVEKREVIVDTDKLQVATPAVEA